MTTLTGGVGYLLSGESYVWTKRGIMKVEELGRTDYVLGLNLEKHDVGFEKMDSPPTRLENDRILRITTDVNELLVPEGTQLYTSAGRKTAQKISKEDMLDIFYRPKAFNTIKDLYNSNPSFDIVVDDHKIPLTEDIAYLVGTQAIAPERCRNRLVLYLQNGLNYRKVCQTLKEALQETGIPHRLLFRAFDYRKIIINDESAENSLVRMVTQLLENNDVPAIIRMSPTGVIKQFIEGLLDSRAQISKGGLIKLVMEASDDKIRRFIYSALALFGIQPRYTFVNETPGGFRQTYLYLALPQDAPFDLKSLAIASQEHLARKSREDTKLYSSVKYAAKFRRGAYLVPRIKEHWDLVSDLALIHHQSIQY